MRLEINLNSQTQLAYSILSLPTVSKGTLVEVKRIRGSIEDFDRFFFLLKELLENSAASPFGAPH